MKGMDAEVSLGIKLYHLKNSEDWQTLEDIAQVIFKDETEKMLNQEDEDERTKMTNNLIQFKKFWKIYTTKILNTIQIPNEEEKT